MSNTKALDELFAYARTWNPYACDEADQAAAELNALKAEIIAAQADLESARDALIYIAEYWNGLENPSATIDALSKIVLCATDWISTHPEVKK